MISQGGQVSRVESNIIGYVLAEKWLDHRHEHAEQSGKTHLRYTEIKFPFLTLECSQCDSVASKVEMKC